ncbi:MAG: hypothetical protein HY902_15685 [Deltaproteobacteria bacterium]|nr:hypothetical protein [Deltaproteobacteria bacterium]
MDRRDMDRPDMHRRGRDQQRGEPRAQWLGRILALGLLILPSLALAAPLDVHFDKFYDASTTATTRLQNDQIKLLMREIGLAIGPRSSGPVYSQGALGMDAAVEMSTSGAKADNDYWKKAVDSPQSSLSSWVIRARKGMPQSVQLGASLTHLQDSNLYAAGVDFQASLIDGFRYVPDFGVRGSVSGVVGNSKMDFLIGAVDVAVSKNFGIMGVLSLQPWLAWSPGFMYVKPNLEPILPNDKSLKMVLPKFNNVTDFTQRASIGLRVVSYRVQVGVELIRSFTDDLNLITGKIGAVF